MTGRLIRIVLYVVLPLVLGTLVYVLFRDRDVPINVLLRGGHSPIATHPPHNALAGLLIGSLPDFAWAWAFGAAIVLVWGARPIGESLYWIIAGGVVASMAEIGQAFALVPGTFDVLDLAAIVMGYALGAMITRSRILRAHNTPFVDY